MISKDADDDRVKSLTAWRLDIRRYGKKSWLAMYKAFMGQPVSNIPRFYKAVNLYGDEAMLDAIIDSSDQNVKGDPLNYVLAVARNKWKEAEKEIEELESYLSDIIKAKELTEKKNRELAEKLGRSE